MTQSGKSEEARAGKCRVCSGPVDERTGRCQDCGAVHGKTYRCPHCRTVADVEPDRVLGERCKVCGGPRIQLDDVTIPRTGRELPALTEARRLRARAIAWRMGSAVLGGFGALALLVALGVLAVVSAGALGTIATLLMAVAPIALAAVGLARARSSDKNAVSEMDRARRFVAADVAAAVEPLNAKKLAALMKVDEARAELLLAELSVEDLVRVRVQEDDAPKARVASDAEVEEEAAAVEESEEGLAEVRETREQK
ncbi:MAG: hypothetical protein KC776_03775 [Myxococcales bacterium]|nr:hypothetical protein [Myxococcales bacterium]MCB9576463.1 hypothetical protein [Polyangiaceae bacterium]